MCTATNLRVTRLCLTLLVICTVSHGNRFNVATISSRGCQYYSKTECHSGGLGIKVIQIMPKIPHSTCIAHVVFSKMRVGALCPDLPTFQDILYVYKMYCPPPFYMLTTKIFLVPSPAWCSVSGGRSPRLASASVLPHVSPSPCLTPPPLAADKSEAGDQSGGEEEGSYRIHGLTLYRPMTPNGVMRLMFPYDQ